FLDTLCQSIWQDTLLFSPPGGSWSGPGIADTTLGIFVPLDAPPGDVQLLYSIVGCDQVFTAHVLEIYVDYSHSACPQEDPLIWNDPPSPTGGYWEGDGIIDPVTGLYDPSLFLNDTYTEIIYYAPNGCSDTTFIHNLQTVIATESISFCLSDEPFQLYDENVGNAPGNNGTWSGPGVEEWWDDGWFITPALAGVGEFMVYFDKNNCTDSMEVRVFPDGISASDYLVCSDAAPFQLDPFVMDGAWWTGPGITDSTGGWFDPSLTPEGLSTCYWNTSAGCLDSVLVTVEYFQQATIAGLNPEYCFADTNLVLDIIPPGGVVSGDLNDVSFNPAVMGEGNYEVIYTWNGAVCTSADTSQFVVFPPIITSVNATDSVICLGESVLITVDASGGHPLLPLQYLWDDGSLPINTHQVSPDITTTYVVTTFDGCTDPAVDTVTVIVLPPILTDVVTSDTVCFGEPGFASAVVLNTGEFSVIWDEVSEDIIESTAGTAHSLLISDLENGCAFDSLVLIPSWSPLTAAFSINPNEDCIAWDEAGSISFIDLSQHAITGTWYFGDNATQTYIQGENPSYSFEQAGQFEVVLVAFNEGNCVDSAFAEVCILPPTPVFIPDIFSPNGDGNNDVFYVRSQGILSMEFVIYNRWGEQVFFSDHPAKGWDGQYRGEPGVADTYMYFLRARMNDGSEYEAKGELLLTR
ncbi:MAG: gliding motility-associated C-terminal domain-containing protein, partial [Flavobacteriales bacterium]|nr:gliding motility-associated C-terminal domain-containing protein [Flavobacteriales bacterium]